MSQNTKQAGPDQIDRKLKVVVFKACHLAVWTDRCMTSDERRYLSYLTDVLCDTQAERKIFREIQLSEVNEASLLSEIKKLDPKNKEFILDKCLEVLASDRSVGLQELKFLKTLRKACGIGYWPYRRKLLRECKHVKAKLASKRLLVLVCLFAFYLILSNIIAHTKNSSSKKDAALTEKCTKKEISVSVVSVIEPDMPSLATGQEVFEQARDSIIYVKVFVGNDPVCSGSGSVIGSDDSGVLYVITNKHVIQNEHTEDEAYRFRAEVQLHSGAKFDTTLDYYSRDHDLAILAVKGMSNYAKPLELILKSGLKVGQPVYAIGSPVGLKHTLTAGVISALRDSSLQTDATVYSGSSGGPLIDERGFLCGVVTRGHRVKDFGFAQYSDAIIEMLDERKKLYFDTETKSATD